MESEDQMNTGRDKVGAGFWFGWFCASVMGYGAGLVLGLIAAYGLFDRPVFDATIGITVGLVAGGMAGILQWIMLREQVAGSGAWVPATAVGLAGALGLAAAIGSGGYSRIEGLLIAALFGIGSGALQWWVLRRAGVGRASLWLPANLLAMLTGPIASRISEPFFAADNYALGAMVFGLLIGTGIGVIDGALLLWLLRQSPSRDTEGLATVH
jgi:hypothetical protein